MNHKRTTLSDNQEKVYKLLPNFNQEPIPLKILRQKYNETYAPPLGRPAISRLLIRIRKIAPVERVFKNGNSETINGYRKGKTPEA